MRLDLLLRLASRSLTTAAALWLALLWAAAGSLATFPGPNGKIALTSTRDGHAQIYVIDADGRRLIRASHSSANDVQPAWSPNRALIAFTSDRDGHSQIYLTRVGRAPRLFRGNLIRDQHWPEINLSHNSANDSEPAWSPDGKRIAFTTDRDGDSQIYVMNSDGTHPMNVSHNSANDSKPAWSPDGTKIAFTTDRDLIPCPECHFGDQFTEEVYVMGVDGSPTRLTHNVWGDTLPGWSPDGRKITIMSGTRFGSLTVVMSADGSGQTFPIQTSDPFSYSQPAWSPNGEQIAFAHSFLGVDGIGHSGIHVFDIDANGETDPGTLVDLSHNATSNWDDAEPDWQPRLSTTRGQCKRGDSPNHSARAKRAAKCVS